MVKQSAFGPPLERRWHFEVRTATLGLEGAATLLIRMLTLALGVLLTACTHYRYIDPQTPEGLDCMHKLDTQVYECEVRAKEIDSLNELQALSVQQCEHNNSFKIPNACPPPPTPSRLPNHCRSGYDEKYTACGGRIEEIED